MVESAKRSSARERYSYSWYFSSSEPKKSSATVQLSELAPSQDQSYGGSAVTEEGQMVEVQGQLYSREPGTSAHNIYNPKPSSSDRSLLAIFIRGPVKVKIGALAGWSSVAGAGAFDFLSRPGGVPGAQLVELAAVWAGIGAIIWFVPSFLKE